MTAWMVGDLWTDGDAARPGVFEGLDDNIPTIRPNLRKQLLVSLPNDILPPWPNGLGLFGNDSDRPARSSRRTPVLLPSWDELAAKSPRSPSKSIRFIAPPFLDFVGFVLLVLLVSSLKKS